MRSKTETLIRTLDGVEASRRVGWARYYREVEENAELRWLLTRLAECVLRSNRLHDDDPAVVLAEEILKSL